VEYIAALRGAAVLGVAGSGAERSGCFESGGEWR